MRKFFSILFNSKSALPLLLVDIIAGFYIIFGFSTIESKVATKLGFSDANLFVGISIFILGLVALANSVVAEWSPKGKNKILKGIALGLYLLTLICFGIVVFSIDIKK